MSEERTALILAPFFRTPSHLGTYRVERFVRWLASARIRVVVVCGGDQDEVVETSWGREVAIRDPLGLHRGVHGGDPLRPGSDAAHRPRRPNALRRSLAHLLFVPDPCIVWAARVVRHPLVRQVGAGAQWVLSSNPPEAPHLAARYLARCFGARLVVDMRDGWLDEPLRPVLRQRWRRVLEAPMERWVLRHASRIFVTSTVWQEHLLERLPALAPRTQVLTNGYPREFAPSVTGAGQVAEDGGVRQDVPRPIELLHAGRFNGSRPGRNSAALLAPLAAGLPPRAPGYGVIRLLGDHTAADLRSAAPWEPVLAARGWQVVWEPAVSRAELFHRLDGAHGLLLLGITRATVPSKIFEYLPTGKPTLAVTPAGSAIAMMLREVPQVFTTDGHDAPAVVQRFAEACESMVTGAHVPVEFADSWLRVRFLEALAV